MFLLYILYISELIGISNWVSSSKENLMTWGERITKLQYHFKEKWKHEVYEAVIKMLSERRGL